VTVSITFTSVVHNEALNKQQQYMFEVCTATAYSFKDLNSNKCPNNGSIVMCFERGSEMIEDQSGYTLVMLLSVSAGIFMN